MPVRPGANATGPSSRGRAVDPQRALAVVRRVVHAGDEVPRDRAPVRRAAVARRPHPPVWRGWYPALSSMKATPSMSRRRPATSTRPAHRHVRLLAGPDVRVCRRARRSRRRAAPRGAGRSARRRSRPLRLSRSRSMPPRPIVVRSRSVPSGSATAHQRWGTRADAGIAHAQHQVGGVVADVAPALQRPRSVHACHAPRRQHQAKVVHFRSPHRQVHRARVSFALCVSSSRERAGSSAARSAAN